MKHHDPETVLGHLADHSYVELRLSPGDTAWNPGSTKTLLHGPAVVKYTRHADGGITATAEVSPTKLKAIGTSDGEHFYLQFADRDGVIEAGSALIDQGFFYWRMVPGGIDDIDLGALTVLRDLGLIDQGSYDHALGERSSFVASILDVV